MLFLPLLENCYRLWVPFEKDATSIFLIKTKEGAVLVDCATVPADITERLWPALDALGVTPTHLFLTHSHADHAGGLPTLVQKAPNLVICSFSETLCAAYPNARLLCDGDRICTDLEAVHLPGHAGDAAGIWDHRTNALFTGDALQLWGIGKYGCGVGNPAAYRATIQKLMARPPKNLFPSHRYFPLGDSALGTEAVMAYLAECEAYFAQLTAWVKADKGRISDPAALAAVLTQNLRQEHPDAPVIPAWTVAAILKEC